MRGRAVKWAWLTASALCTALLFVVMFVLILVPHIPAAAANALIAVCAVVMAATLIMYIPVFRKM